MRGGGESRTVGGQILCSRPSGTPPTPTREVGGWGWRGFIQHPAELTGDPEAGLLALQVALEVVGVALAASVVEDLALLRDGVVEVALDLRPARPLVHREQAGAWKQRQEQQTGR